MVINYKKIKLNPLINNITNFKMQKRYISLDVLRGLTVTFMCIVNNPGNWGKIFAPLRHANWDGCTPTDLVYPFFVFCMGCAMAFSFRKFDGLEKATVKKVVKRGLAIFLVGFLLCLYPFFPTKLNPDLTFIQNFIEWLNYKRIFGVLQRIGLAYIVGGLIALWLRKPTKIIIAIGVLCTLFTGILVAFGGEPGPFTLEGNIAGKIDIALLGENHVYRGFGIPFDPEGLLGVITASCNVLLGYLVGRLILRTSTRYAKGYQISTNTPAYLVTRIFVYSAICLAIGSVLSIWIPINKALWSASYVFYTSGWAMFALAFFAYWIDIKGNTKAFKFFTIMGTNPLIAFIASAVIVKTMIIFGISPSRMFGGFFSQSQFTSLIHALLFTFIIFVIQWILYKKKIVVKI